MPSAEDATENQFSLGALVCVHVWAKEKGRAKPPKIVKRRNLTGFICLDCLFISQLSQILSTVLQLRFCIFDDGVPVGAMDLHLQRIRVNAINGGRTDLGKHDASLTTTPARKQSQKTATGQTGGSATVNRQPKGIDVAMGALDRGVSAVGESHYGTVRHHCKTR